MLEYIDGGSLQDVVDDGGCTHEPTIASIALQALQGLNYLHGCSQIHRDLKPGSNISIVLSVDFY
jgi:serine/threonine protein kinase